MENIAIINAGINLKKKNNKKRGVQTDTNQFGYLKLSSSLGSICSL